MAEASITAYTARYDLAFQVAPIILLGGIASGTQGNMQPITAYTGGMPSTLDNAFARYLPLPNSTLISQSVATYPFANQSIAANATITQPLTLSMLMLAPVNQPGGFLSKLPTFTALQKALAQHNALGGMYIVATPAYVYNFLLMTAMTDVTAEGEISKQQQIKWQIDFVQPLLTLEAAAAAQGALFQAVTSGQQLANPASWSGLTSASPASASGVTGALGNAPNQNTAATSSVASVSQALATFGGQL